MQLILTNNKQAFNITRLAEARNLCMVAQQGGRILDEGEVLATLDCLGVIYDVEGGRVDL